MDSGDLEYDWQRPRGLAPKSRVYLYLRTRLPFILSGREVWDLADALPSWIRVLANHDERSVWKNGFVLSFDCSETATEIATIVKEPLNCFDAWAIVDDRGNCAEGPIGGPLSHYFKDGVAGVAQLFFQFRPRQDEDALTDAIKSRFRDDQGARSVFAFADGRIMLVRTQEPVRTIKSRLQEEIPRLSKFIACGADGEIWSPRGSCRWDWSLDFDFEEIDWNPST